MAKARVLEDRIKITSEVLTDEVLEKVMTLAPSALTITDAYSTEDERVLYEVVKGDVNTFTKFGASFKDGATVGTISAATMELPKEEREAKIKNHLIRVLNYINNIEEQVKEFMEHVEDLDFEIDFLD